MTEPVKFPALPKDVWINIEALAEAAWLAGKSAALEDSWETSTFKEEWRNTFCTNYSMINTRSQK